MNLDAGGAQTFIASLAIEQKKIGHDVSIIVIDELVNSDFQKLLINNLNEHSVHLYFLDRRIGRNATVINTIKGIVTTLSTVEPDIINTHISTSHLLTNLCLRFANLKKLKNRHIITVHNAPERWSWMTLKFNAHTPSIYCSYSALEMNPQRDCLKVAIQNGIPYPKIDNSAEQLLDEFSANKPRKFVLCVGRLSLQKNYDLVCKIARYFEDKDVDFLVCGIKQETAEQDLQNFSALSNIHYLGTKSQKEVYSLMGHCDCFLNASLFEGLPITVLEAFFTGIPCVLSDIPPHVEIGADMPYCYIADLESEESFIDKIKIALSHSESKGEILDFRQPFLESYSIVATAKNYDKFYNEVLQSI
jgi:glycosyltransferase involved in cell wall biosynthesis